MSEPIVVPVVCAVCVDGYYEDDYGKSAPCPNNCSSVDGKQTYSATLSPESREARELEIGRLRIVAHETYAAWEAAGCPKESDLIRQNAAAHEAIGAALLALAPSPAVGDGKEGAGGE